MKEQPPTIFNATTKELTDVTIVLTVALMFLITLVYVVLTGHRPSVEFVAVAGVITFTTMWVSVFITAVAYRNGFDSKDGEDDDFE